VNIHTISYIRGKRAAVSRFDPMRPQDISIADYSYVLPGESIAFYPLAERDASRLLVFRGGQISETNYRHIADELPPESLLVFNNTRVIEARIVFQKPSGGRIEIFCLEPPPGIGIALAMAQSGSVRWKCLIGGASKWKAGQVLVKRIPTEGNHAEGIAGGFVLEARYLEKLDDAFLIELSWTPTGVSFAELLHHAGLIPLPPYIHRTPDASDAERYQTIYARHEGSVAAPTAGLHFTENVLQTLEQKDIGRSFVTLHVGAGTFMPVKTATLGDHPMHTEFISVIRETIAGLVETLASGKRVIAVGTTSARTIESLYWLGVKTLLAPGIGSTDLAVKQWDAYEITGTAAPEAALTALLDWMERTGVPGLTSATQLLITPGYRWRLTGGLITNFHQPESTLLLLVASLVGEDWRRIYRYALDKGFRFLSYGDGSLLLP
jgi:S-adenosylmethionine:tRNA ribosyltransferase-isomerase